jgi:hypothetical protein
MGKALVLDWSYESKLRDCRVSQVKTPSRIFMGALSIPLLYHALL